MNKEYGIVRLYDLVSISVSALAITIYFVIA